MAFRCVGERAGLLLGLNRASFKSSMGSRIPLRYEIGNESAETDGAVVSDETLELDEDVARSVMAHTTDANVLRAVWRCAESGALIQGDGGVNV